MATEEKEGGRREEGGGRREKGGRRRRRQEGTKGGRRRRTEPRTVYTPFGSFPPSQLRKLPSDGLKAAITCIIIDIFPNFTRLVTVTRKILHVNRTLVSMAAVTRKPH